MYTHTNEITNAEGVEFHLNAPAVGDGEEGVSGPLQMAFIVLLQCSS